jgi:UDP-glucose 4-epimerase
MTSELRGRRVLVLGGQGFIGSNVAVAAVAAGAEVTVFDQLHPRAGGNAANLRAVDGAVRLVHGDVRDPVAVAEVIRNADVAINCAALSSHPDSNRHPVENTEVNCVGLLHLLEAIRLYNPALHFVQVGTSTQVGRMLAPIIDETHPEFPLDVYSANKVAGEKYVLLYHRVHGLHTSVVRLANTYGPRACIRTPEFGFVNYFVGRALRGQTITVYGDGLQQRNLSFVEDTVAALLLAATDARANGEVFFATADTQVPVVEIARAITDTIGGTLEFVPWPAERAAIEFGDAVISNQKIRTQLGWAPTVSLTEGLQRTRAYFAAQLSDYLG